MLGFILKPNYPYAGYAQILLETGETPTVADTDFCIVSGDYGALSDVIPPYLLACARTICAAQPSAVFDADKYDAFYGKFTKVCLLKLMEFSDTRWLIDNADAKHAIKNACVSQTYQIDGTAYSVTLDGHRTEKGPYLTARLIDATSGTGATLVRLDRPRRRTSAGVYVFPLHDAAIQVIVD